MRLRRKQGLPPASPSAPVVGAGSPAPAPGAAASNSPAARHLRLLERVQNAAPDEDARARFLSVWPQILEMRRDRSAAVDVHGCDQQAFGAATAALKRYHHLTACLLSSRTSDLANAAAMDRLRKFGLSPARIAACDEHELAAVLYGVGFHRTKAKNLKAISSVLLERYGGDIPESYDEIVALPGIGPKMALIVMSAARGESLGIAVDVHVHRISNRIGFVRTRTPEETCVRLAEAVPRPLWPEANRVLVGFGQQICLPRNPRCASCAISASCDYYAENMQQSVADSDRAPRPTRKRRRGVRFELKPPLPPPVSTALDALESFQHRDNENG